MPQKRKLAVSSTDNYQIFYYSSGYRIATIDTGIYIRVHIYIYLVQFKHLQTLDMIFFLNRNNIDSP